MKKMVVILAFAPFLIGISSCGSSNPSMIQINQEIISKNEPTSDEKVADWTYSVNGEYTKSLMNSGQDFTLYIASETCSHCVAASPNIIKYIYNSKALIYYMETDLYSDVYDEYSKIYNNALGEPPASLVTPTLMFFKGRTLINYVEGNGRLGNITATTNLFNSQTKITNVSHIDTLQTLDNFLVSGSSIVFFYDMNDTNAINSYQNVFKNISNNSEGKTAIFDMNSLSDEERTLLINKFDLKQIYSPQYVRFENGEKKDEFIYEGESSNESLTTYLNNYL